MEELLETVPFTDAYKLPPIDETYPCPYEEESGYIFLKGACNIFSKALKLIYGYQVYEITNGKGNHWYCKTLYNEREVFIDVRGGTTDFKSFSSPYSFIKAMDEPMPIERQTNEMEFEDEPWRDTGLLYALSIITTYPNYYGSFDSVSSFGKIV